MRPLGITDVKNTSLYINSTMQVTSKLTPCYFLRHVSLHPTIKCCRLIRKHILRFRKNNYLGRDNTFSFCPWIPVKPLFPLFPFNPVDPLKPVGPIGPVSPFSPGEPTAPISPFSPLTPCGPVGPSFPLTPWAPVSPLGPRGPVFPGAPFPPFYPGYPGAPGTPWGPCWPVWQILSVVAHACVIFLSISWRSCCKDITPGVGATFLLSRRSWSTARFTVSWEMAEKAK